MSLVLDGHKHCSSAVFCFLVLIIAICSLEKIRISDAYKHTTKAPTTRTPPSCPLYEEWKECAPKLCQPSCGGGILHCPRIPPCKPGSGKGACVCKPGYIRAVQQGPCIQKTKCCSKKAYEVWSQCGIACQNVCGQPNRFCPHLCPYEGGCVCESGYIRNATGGKCFPRSKCPCPKYEVFSNSTNWCCKNFKTCSNMSPICNKACMVGGGCVCAPGYIRKSVGGKCVPIKSCNHSCAANEHWQTCARPSCEPNCGNRTPICPKIALLCRQGEGACVCNSGLIRLSPNGKCIPVKKCPMKPCPVYEVFSNSTTWCCKNEKTCSNLSPVCKQACKHGSGCICASGYVRQSIGGKCVSISKCPKDECDP